MTLIPKGCKRCGGDLFLESDYYGVFWQCLACGGVWNVLIKPKRSTSKRSLIDFRYKVKNIDNNRCPRCGRPKDNGYSMCRICLDRNFIYTRRYKERKRKSGLCLDCGRPVKPGRLHCQICLDKASERKYGKAGDLD